MFTESWWSRIGSFGAAAVWLVAGLIIVTRPGWFSIYSRGDW